MQLVSFKLCIHMHIIVVHFIREKPIQEESETCVTILYLNVKATELYTVTAGNPQQEYMTPSSIFLQSLPAHAASHLQCLQFDLIQLIVW